MRYRTLAIIVVLAIAHTLIAAGVWWVTRPAPAPEVVRPEPAAPTPLTAGFQRLAEVYARTAFRSVITHDYAALSELMTRAAGWPEVRYVSVEDVQGKILAHTDPARIGRMWTPAMAVELSAGPGGHREVAAPMTAAGQASGSVGHVRIGYFLEEPVAVPPPPPPPAPARRPGARLALVLTIAGLGAIPLGLALTALAGAGQTSAARPAPVDLRGVRTIRQAKLAIGQLMREAEVRRGEAATLRTELEARAAQAAHLREELGQRTSQLAEAAHGNGELRVESARLQEAHERLVAELEERQLELERTRLELDRRSEELADVRSEVDEARAALAGPPLVSRELVEQEAKQRQTRAVGYVSHAIRSSLTNVLGFSKLLLRGGDGPLTDTQRTDVLTVQQAGERLLAVMNDVVDLTRLENGSLLLREDVVDVASLIHEVTVGLAGRGALDVRIDCPPDLPPARGDRERLAHILRTFLDQGATAPSREVSVRARATGDTIDLAVTHPASLIAPEDIPTLFDPFPPTDPGAPVEDDGRRLRLALARAVAVAGGGGVSVEPGDDGTTFILTVPVAVSLLSVA